MIAFGECYRAWLEAELDTHLPTAATFIAHDGLRFFGVVCITNWTGPNCEMHYAGRGPWITRKFMRAVFGYVFKELGCRRVTGFVDARLGGVLDIDRRLGFTIEGRMRDALVDGDVLVIGMLRSECRWIDEQEERTQAPADAQPAADHRGAGAGQPRGPDQPIRICDVSDWSERDQCRDPAQPADAGAG